MSILVSAFAQMRAVFKERPLKAGNPRLGGRNFDSSTGDSFTSTPYDVERFFGVVEESFQRQPTALQLSTGNSDKREDFYEETTQVPFDFQGFEPVNYDLLFGVDEEL